MTTPRSWFLPSKPKHLLQAHAREAGHWKLSRFATGSLNPTLKQKPWSIIRASYRHSCCSGARWCCESGKIVQILHFSKLLLRKKITRLAGRLGLPTVPAKQFIDQHAFVPQVILELHYIVVAVVAAHQMRLRAAPHPAYLF